MIEDKWDNFTLEKLARCSFRLNFGGRSSTSVT